MRSSIAKLLRKTLVKYATRKGYSDPHVKFIYRKVKKDYTGTPKNKRNSFTMFETK